MKTVECPVTGGKVDGDTCFRIVLVVDGEVQRTVHHKVLRRRRVLAR